MSGPAGGLHLIIQYCRSQNPERQKEYDFCVDKNLNHPAVIRVHNLLEPQTDVPPAIREHPKYTEHGGEEWLTYARAFALANETIGPGAFCCICNLDIFLDHATAWAEALDLIARNPNIVLCLSRHEFDGSGRAWLDQGFARLAMANTQDAWLFRTPIAVQDCDFRLGQPGCDNAIAHRLKQSGYLPLNSPISFKVFHYDTLRNNATLSQRWQHQHSKGSNQYPERQGQLLLPAFEQVQSLDTLMSDLKLSPLQKYEIICEIFSRFVKITNP